MMHLFHLCCDTMQCCFTCNAAVQYQTNSLWIWCKMLFQPHCVGPEINQNITLCYHPKIFNATKHTFYEYASQFEHKMIWFYQSSFILFIHFFVSNHTATINNRMQCCQFFFMDIPAHEIFLFSFFKTLQYDLMMWVNHNKECIVHTFFWHLSHNLRTLMTSPMWKQPCHTHFVPFLFHTMAPTLPICIDVAISTNNNTLNSLTLLLFLL